MLSTYLSLFQNLLYCIDFSPQDYNYILHIFQCQKRNSLQDQNYFDNLVSSFDTKHILTPVSPPLFVRARRGRRGRVRGLPVDEPGRRVLDQHEPVVVGEGEGVHAKVEPVPVSSGGGGLRRREEVGVVADLRLYGGKIAMFEILIRLHESPARNRRASAVPA